jgi:hypothetical protein
MTAGWRASSAAGASWYRDAGERRPLVLGGVTASNGVSTGLSAYANVVGDPKLPSGEQSLDRWFNTAAFSQPAPFTFGTGARTYPAVRGPKVRRLDLLLSRLQKLGTSTVEFRIEAQNKLNTPQFGEPVSSLTDANLGRIITGGGERRLQLGVRWGF